MTPGCAQGLDVAGQLEEMGATASTLQALMHPKTLQWGQAPLAGPGSLPRVLPQKMRSWHGQGPVLLELSLDGRAPHLLPWGL